MRPRIGDRRATVARRNHAKLVMLLHFFFFYRPSFTDNTLPVDDCGHTITMSSSTLMIVGKALSAELCLCMGFFRTRPSTGNRK